jgi:hypothetical protein
MTAAIIHHSTGTYASISNAASHFAIIIYQAIYKEVSKFKA